MRIGNHAALYDVFQAEANVPRAAPNVAGALLILATFYATMVATGYLIELIFGGLVLIPAGRHAKVIEASVQWTYTTVLNVIFLLLAAALCYRFVCTGGIPMLRMMAAHPKTRAAIAMPIQGTDPELAVPPG